ASPNSSLKKSASLLFPAPASTIVPPTAPHRSASPFARRKKRSLPPKIAFPSCTSKQTEARLMRKIAAAIFFLLATPLFAQEINPAHAFDYDSKAPLNIQEAGVEHRGNVAIHDISYESPKGGRVPA